MVKTQYTSREFEPPRGESLVVALGRGWHAGGRLMRKLKRRCFASNQGGVYVDVRRIIRPTPTLDQPRPAVSTQDAK